MNVKVENSTHILESQSGSNTNILDSKVQSVEKVGISNIELLSTNSEGIKAKAMELTDSWGQAMFIMDPSLVENLFSTIGFSPAVSAKVYDGVHSLAYVQSKDKGTGQPEVTWHAMDVTCMTLRGIIDLGAAMIAFDDKNVEWFLKKNINFFEDLMGVMPDYTRKLMFSPEVASTVMATLGAKVSADKVYELASKYGRQVTKDLDGRRGVSTQFIRSLTLTISARADVI